MTDDLDAATLTFVFFPFRATESRSVLNPV